MENASKALLIAGGILLLMILVSLILYVKGTVSEYYASEQQLEDIADTAKFNEQFTNYNRKDVQGYELISLVNKVVDYNERLSTEGSNDVKAKPIEVIINFWNTGANKYTSQQTTDATDTKIFQFTYDQKLRLFTNKTITQNNNINSLKDILDNIKEIEDSNKNIPTLTKSINSIYGVQLTGTNDNDKEKMLKAISAFNTSIGYKKYLNANKEYTYDEVKKAYNDILSDSDYKKEDIYRYYEYTQFRKAYFECKKLDYDSTTGKVNSLEFTFTGEIE